MRIWRSGSNPSPRGRSVQGGQTPRAEYSPLMRALRRVHFAKMSVLQNGTGSKYRHGWPRQRLGFLELGLASSHVAVIASGEMARCEGTS